MLLNGSFNVLGEDGAHLEIPGPPTRHAVKFQQLDQEAGQAAVLRAVGPEDPGSPANLPARDARPPG
jgi:hypothetical protein